MGDRDLSGIVLPGWVEKVRPWQAEAVHQIMTAYRRGVDLVVLDAPTGSGKTLIAEMVRQLIDPVTGSYVCSSLTLQDQYTRDFPKADVVKGRSNYPTDQPGVDAGDCAGVGCQLCVGGLKTCSYQKAKEAARESSQAVLNTAFQLYQSNYGGEFKGRDLIVWDECDELEGQLMGFVQVVISRRNAEFVGKQLPKKGVRYSTIQRWLEDWVKRAKTKHKAKPKEERAFRGLVRNVEGMLKDDEGEWVRQNQHNALVMKPVKVSMFGKQRLWDKGNKHLLMSATVISPSQLLDDLGWKESYAVVSVPMTFPVENRPIYVDGTVDMAYKGREDNWPLMARRLEQVLGEHEHENVLVHTVSYELTRFLYNETATDRLKHVYFSAAERARALDAFKDEGGVLFAPSMDRGVDFAEDHARVIVLCKVPFPYLGDTQISTRLHSPGGQGWYTTQTIRTIVQMTGRGVRSANDRATTYILDDQFRRVYSQHRKLFPSWWREALQYQIP